MEGEPESAGTLLEVASIRTWFLVGRHGVRRVRGSETVILGS